MGVGVGDTGGCGRKGNKKKKKHVANTLVPKTIMWFAPNQEIDHTGFA